MSAITFAKSAKYFFNSNVLILVASHLGAKHNQKHLEKWSNCLKYVTNALGGAFKADHILLTTWGVFLKIPTFCNQKIFLPHQAGHTVDFRLARGTDSQLVVGKAREKRFKQTRIPPIFFLLWSTSKSHLNSFQNEATFISSSYSRCIGYRYAFISAAWLH